MLYRDYHTHLSTLHQDELQRFTDELYHIAQTGLIKKHHLIWNMGMRPSAYESSLNLVSDPLELYRQGIGFHPWEISQNSLNIQHELDIFDALLESNPTALIGELGLDFSVKHRSSQAEQLYVLDHLLARIARMGAYALSLHAVQSTSTVLDMLEHHDLLPHIPGAPLVIFHWFSGSSEDLYRARKLGCLFSINPAMLRSKKGRAYVQSIEIKQLVLESDEHIRDCRGNLEAYCALMHRSLSQIAQLKRLEPGALQDLFADTGRLES